jgi:hypothetical protein
VIDSKRTQADAVSTAPSALTAALMIVAGTVLPVVAAVAFAAACAMGAWL